MAEADGPDLLRVVACGSVDDGKSTLIGRLLHEAGAIPDDQAAALAAVSRMSGTQGDAVDYALLLDGLSAEREQGITIDVAYRYFATPRRSFILADAPGHAQFTRNMATGASTADLAIILVDAGKGVLTQTRRHSWLVHLLGVRRVVLAVNKLDLVGFDRAVFDAIVADYHAFAGELGIVEVIAIPVSAVGGDNLVTRSPAMPWYAGPPLLELLETVSVAPPAAAAFRLPVQWVARPDPGFRGYAGRIAGGSVQPGDPVRVLPGGQEAAVARIVAMPGDRDRADAGSSVMLTFDRELDCARGDVIVARDDPPAVADRFETTLLWFGDAPLVPGRGYWLKLATQEATATVQPPKYGIDVDSRERLAARTLALNGIGVAEVATDRPLVFEPYADSRTLGGFILIDKETSATVAAGLIHFALRRTQNLHWQPATVTRDAHAALKGQAPRVLWFTGLSGAGKSTIANLVEQRLHARGRHSFLLDGDNVRHGLNKDLGFTEPDRIENVRRVGEVAKLMTDAGLIVLAAFISPFRAERAMVRELFPAGEFVEVFVDAPLAVAEARDPKGLYRKARAGALANFTGIDSPYEPPATPELRIDTMRLSAEAAADLIVAYLEEQR